MSFFFFIVALSCYVVGAFGSLLYKKSRNVSAKWWSNAWAIAGSAFGVFFSSAVLFSGTILSWQSTLPHPLLSLSVRVDRLSAFFLLLVFFVAILASVYSIGYSKHYQGNEYRIGALGFFYNIFLAGMALVVTAHHGMYFLVVWEIMSLASYFLVVFEGESEENQKAGIWYFAMTHIGTAFLTVAFLLIYRATGSFDFSVIKEQMGLVSPAVQSVVFVCSLIGFGTKAGMIPFHVWLPKAHPAAPSFVSALMSGVMIKTGIYMLIRISMDLMPNAPVWWGVSLVLIGACSAFLGVLYALTEGDIKKMLAYCSIENIGIILLGLGCSLIFWSLNMPAIAMLALAASLFHTLNHAIYKALLFFCAGSLISSTHTRNMEEYGGLIKRMPVTGACFLIGSMAICALPPFNGFFSEWMTLQSLFAGIVSAPSAIRWVLLIGASALAFSGGLAAMTFVKAFGTSFLARPRTEKAEKAKESSVSMRMSMMVLATATLAVGLFAEKISSLFFLIAGERSSFSSISSLSSVDPYIHGTSSVSMPILAIALIGTLGIVWIVVRLVTQKRVIRFGRTWDCGTTLQPRMEITPMGFSRTMVLIFKGVLRPTKQMSNEYRDADTRYFSKPDAIEFGFKNIYQAHVYGPLQKLVTALSNLAKAVQNGNVNMYVLYVLVTLVVLIFIVRFL